MAQGHMIPMVDIAKLLASRGVMVTIVTTPLNAARFESSLNRVIDELDLLIELVKLRFPCVEAGLPEGCENCDMLPSIVYMGPMLKAATMMEPEVVALFEGMAVRPMCIISDFCLPYTNNVAKKFNIPRITFTGFSCFCLVVGSDHEYFVLPGLPGKIEFTKVQLPILIRELEPDYFSVYKNSKQGKVWCVGPVSLTNHNKMDKLQRGSNTISLSNHSLDWLDTKEPKSVIYVCFGSICNLSSPQLIELALGLEASGKPFIWAFRDRVAGRGLVIRGWAPQVSILSHDSVGGFLTHCGWNSSLEGISAGVPLVTWPLFADQFSNEKLIVEVVRIGVRVGVEKPTVFEWKEDTNVSVKREDVGRAVRLVMEGGEEGDERRNRAKELAKMAKRAVESGGSSYKNIDVLIEDIVKHQKVRSD
ncbi:UDP-glycosyltransferase 73C25 [Linum perenne]